MRVMTPGGTNLDPLFDEKHDGPATIAAKGKLPDKEHYSATQNFMRGLSGKAKTDTASILKEHYPEIYGDTDRNGSPNAGGFAASLAGDLFLDPLTYIPGDRKSVV